MFAQAFAVVLQAIDYVWSIFVQLLDTFKFRGVLVALFGIGATIRFLITPLLGQASSDNASMLYSKIKGDKSSTKNTRVKGQKAIESKSRVGKK